MAIKLEGGGGEALMAWPLVEEFFAASLNAYVAYMFVQLDVYGRK